MEKQLLQIKEEALNEISECKDAQALSQIKVKYLGKSGSLTSILRGMRDVAPEDRPRVGALVNEVRGVIESSVANLEEKFEKEELEKKLEASKIDITENFETHKGSMHPRTIIQKNIEDIFISMGFIVEDGQEVVTEYENFDAVNVPQNHPARDMQDTFWLDNGQLLRTQTSAMQNAILRKYKAPCKAIIPGRVYRNEELDNSHENTFFQIEGMVVDKDLTVANLLYFMKEMLSKIYNREINVRLRPGFFPFTEPSFELDITCPFCEGKGCPTCKQGGWVELCPCGMIHPNVLREGGIDPNEYNGFAFGLGYDRLVMMKGNLNDIRLLNSGNIKLLEQFGTK